MNRTSWISLPVIALLGFSLAACSTGETTSDAPAETTAPSAPAEELTPSVSAAPTDEPADQQQSDGRTDDLTAVALRAIVTAESETGGTAFAIDDQDEDGTWEVDTATANASVEVTVASDGRDVVRTENDDLDADDRRALDSADVSITEAIAAAIDEAGGQLDDAELSDDDGRVVWDITVDTADRDDVDVLVDAASGDIVADRDDRDDHDDRDDDQDDRDDD